MSTELPKDAEGRVIPFDTKVLYDKHGNERKVYQFTFPQYPQRWLVELKMPCSLTACLPENYWLVPPDSFKQLAEDLNRAANYKKLDYYFPEPSCAYANHRGDTCDGCKLLEDQANTCLAAVLKDVTARVNRLCDDAE